MSDIGEIALLVGVPVGFVILFGILLKYGDKKAQPVTNVTRTDDLDTSDNGSESQGSFASSYDSTTINNGPYRPSEGGGRGGRRRSAKSKRAKSKKSSHHRHSKSKNRK